MIDGSSAKRRAAITLLRSAKSRNALRRAKPAIRQLSGDDSYAPSQLAADIESVLAELSSETNASRRFDVLRRSDVDGESHDAIAKDVGLSRSQFYRDLREARERFASALEERLTAKASAGVDPRFLAIEALRDGGQFARAAAMADVLARTGNREDAARALCLRAELEIENGTFSPPPAQPPRKRENSSTTPTSRCANGRRRMRARGLRERPTAWDRRNRRTCVALRSYACAELSMWQRCIGLDAG